MQKSYRVLEAAGPWVAGVRNPGKGKTIKLTEEQAQYAVIAGELEDPAVSKAKPVDADKPAAKAPAKEKG
ncbi:hypothetical protein LC092_10885 [Stappia stellulata]|uniref:hypothetical protein n=1 Tax=Stappia stellulata TaxID=71235 RepID=UPI001CD2EA14|nr:hypothetical protein [Stappia stellulata]MCA1242944.1 hypothetical protein [Stappia stellulata]